MIVYHNARESMEMECDACGNDDVFQGNFVECIHQAKQTGWTIKKSNDGWEHYCSPSCKAEVYGE